jgi:hypothetical protein
MTAYRPLSQRRHDRAEHSDSHRTAGLLQGHWLPSRSLEFTREGDVQASVLQDLLLWLMVLVSQQEVDSCRSFDSSPAAAARLLTLLLNDSHGGCQPLKP